MKGDIIAAVVFCAIICFVIILRVLNKQKQKKRAEEIILTEQNEYNALKEKIVNNEKLIAWAEEVAESICSVVEKLSCDVTIDIKVYNQDLTVGQQLQDKYYPAIKEFSWNNNEPLFKWHFASENLPDLKNNQHENFSKIFGAMINSYMKEFGYETHLTEVRRVMSYDDSDYMCRITCYKKKVQGSW